MNKFLVAATALAAVMFASGAQAATVYSGAGFQITDNSTRTATITVGENFSLSDVNITLLGLSHTFWGDLDISLSHGGTTIWLTTDNGGGSDPSGDYTFDDQSATLVTALGPTGGTFQSQQLLAAFNGMSAFGDWTLTVTDDAGADAGRLNGWSLSLDGLSSAVPEPSTWAMMLLGFFGLGSMVRASRRKEAGVLA